MAVIDPFSVEEETGKKSILFLPVTLWTELSNFLLIYYIKQRVFLQYRMVNNVYFFYHLFN